MLIANRSRVSKDLCKFREGMGRLPTWCFVSGARSDLDQQQLSSLVLPPAVLQGQGGWHCCNRSQQLRRGSEHAVEWQARGGGGRMEGGLIRSLLSQRCHFRHPGVHRMKPHFQKALICPWQFVSCCVDRSGSPPSFKQAHCLKHYFDLLERNTSSLHFAVSL